MNATTLQLLYTNVSNQSTMNCIGNPQANIRKFVHPSMPVFTLWETELRFQSAICRTNVADFLNIINQQNFFARDEKYCIF